eukprot:PhF_6_TR35500/c0_g1_i2/m.51765
MSANSGDPVALSSSMTTTSNSSIVSPPPLPPAVLLSPTKKPVRTVQAIQKENNVFRDILPQLRAEVHKLEELKSKPLRRKLVVERSVRDAPLFEHVIVFRPLRKMKTE